MNKVLLWDFDGTLVYQIEPFVLAAQHTLTQCDVSVSTDEIREYLNGILSWKKPDIVYTDRCGDFWWDTLFEKLAPFYYSFGISAELYETIKAKYRNKIADWRNYTLYEDTISVLESCTSMGYRNYIMSNNYPELQSIVEALGLGQYFSGYFVSACIGYEKPRKELFEYALVQAGNPECCYMIGDNPISDIEGGRNAGLKTIFVHREIPSNANHFCKKLSEIPALLE